MTDAHTPGIWAVDIDDGDVAIFCGGVKIAAIDGAEAEYMANAQLITAAPDMLAELKAVEAHLHTYVEAIEEGGGSASKSAERLASVRAVIAKATGSAV